MLNPCSIVILSHNGASFTEICLRQLLQCELPTELILCDNGSTDSIPEVFAKFKLQFEEVGVVVKVISNGENLGCSLARNIGWREATQPYVLFMDNDTAPKDYYYLSKLIQCMEENPGLGVLGPKMIYPYEPHQIQCAGVDITPQGRVIFRGRGEKISATEFNEFRKVPVLISACWIMHRHYLETLNGLDEYFHPVQYEDFDFCMRVNQNGDYCAYTPTVEIYHFEGKTTGSWGKKEYSHNIAAQSLKFRKRWHQEFKKYPKLEGEFRWLADEELGLNPSLVVNLDIVKR